jgi:ferredoxin-type protein NapG
VKKKGEQNNSRREAIQKMLQTTGLIGIGGLAWGAYGAKASEDEFVLRPPGALDEKNFKKACIKCGICVESCPYDTLKLAKPENGPLTGTPFFEPRDIPCYMCPDIPCVPDCPSGALDINKVSVPDPEKGGEKLEIKEAQMGTAIIDIDSCLAYWGIQCDACYRACPLLDEAITLEYKRNIRTGKHAMLQPVVHKEICTGCGVCEHVCVTEESAIMILPVNKVSGKTGAHYIKSWDQKDEERLKDIKDVKPEADKPNATQEYLNNWKDLIDD